MTPPGGKAGKPSSTRRKKLSLEEQPGPSGLSDAEKAALAARHSSVPERPAGTGATGCMDTLRALIAQGRKAGGSGTSQTPSESAPATTKTPATPPTAALPVARRPSISYVTLPAEESASESEPDEDEDDEDDAVEVQEEETSEEEEEEERRHHRDRKKKIKPGKLTVQAT